VTFRDGLIVTIAKYWNPQVFMKAMRGGSFSIHDEQQIPSCQNVKRNADMSDY
jgi:hypothetical protein